MGRRSLEKLQEDEQLEQLPVSRIKTIMKSSPEVEGIRKEALFLVNKATEFFIQFLASTAYVRTNEARELDYDYLSEIVQEDKRLTFMKDLFPKRITYKEYKELVEKKRQKALLKQQEEHCLTDEDAQESASEKPSKSPTVKKSSANNQLEKKKDGSPVKVEKRVKFSSPGKLNPVSPKNDTTKVLGEDKYLKLQDDVQHKEGDVCDESDADDSDDAECVGKEVSSCSIDENEMNVDEEMADELTCSKETQE